MSGLIKGASGLVMLAEIVADNSAAVAFTSKLSASYDDYMIMFCDLVPSVNSQLEFKVSLNSGAAWLAGEYDYFNNTAYQFAAGVGGAQSQVAVGHATDSVYLVGATGKPSAGVFRLFDANSTQEKLVSCDAVIVSPSSQPVTQSCATKISSAVTAINGIKFYMSSGNIVRGRFRLYGIAKA